MVMVLLAYTIYFSYPTLIVSANYFVLSLESYLFALMSNLRLLSALIVANCYGNL